VKYVKSPGSLPLLLTSNFKKKIAIIVLPSFKIKLFNNSCYAFPNFIQTSSKIFFFFQKAGYNKSKGWRSTVRGTVKNACDHPNGGRTRSLKLARTP
jgi:ribosomal protein L2